MEIKRLSKNIIYAGVNDAALDLFESQYKISEGVTYNSYVIRDRKLAVIDTVDDRATDQWFDNLEEIFDGKAPDYLVISHLEPDHSANIQRFLTKYPETQVVANAKTISMLPQFFDIDLEKLSLLEVKEADTLCLGEHVLRFIMAPMVHWPEVMMEYEETEKILFSADGFGTFGTLNKDIFYQADNKDDRQIELEWTKEARRYFINIVGKYGTNVKNVLKKLQNLDIRSIAPLHGPVLTGNLEYFLNKYTNWSGYEPEEKGVVVAYASIYGNTKAAAEKLVKALEKSGEKNTVIFDLARDDMAEAVAQSFRYDFLVLAGVTYDSGLMPCMEDFLYHLKMKNYQNRYAAIIENGSWASKSGKLIKAYLDSLKNITVLEDMLTIKSVLKKSEEEKIYAFAEKISQR